VSGDGYPPIAGYGFIADCHSSALVSRSGSIDWCCMPRLDSESIFGRLLDWDEGGYCRFEPAGEYRAERRYLERTLVLETTFSTGEGEVRLTDCFVMREGGREDPAQQILRVVEGIRGQVELEVEIVPRFDYGDVRPWVREQGDAFALFGSDDGLLVFGDLDLRIEDGHGLIGFLTLAEGQRKRLAIAYAPSEELDLDPGEVLGVGDLDRRLEETIEWWRRWAGRGRAPEGADAEAVLRSAAVLKGLTNARTGAIAAAATTSLPEVPGGGRNWDYRFTWIRDSTWAVRSLLQLGHDREADRFRRFVERTSAGHVDDLQIVYGIGGEFRLHEMEIEMEGYREAGPVRIGNRASGQEQNDVYGELLMLAWLWHEHGHAVDDHYWSFLVELVERAIDRWSEPDRGLWEERREPQHFVHSKAMCWAAVDRGLRLAEDGGRTVPVERWEEARQEIRQAIETQGYDEERGVFVRTFGGREVDGALLLLPEIGFLAWDDERMVRTTDAIRKDLDADGLLYRFRWDEPGAHEGAFLPCSFWMAECLARQGRVEEAEEIFRRAAETANDVGLFAEEYDPEEDEMLGNFPQALTHLTHISAALALAEAGQG
jgi:GH15 family glucan-1,4-alpha-glucosidase